MDTDPNVEKIILIVEDDKDVRENCIDFLTEEGFNAISAIEGEEAVNQCKINPAIGLILMDIDMNGGMNGIEAMKQIKCFSPKSTIFSISGRDPVEELEKLRKDGEPWFDGYLRKPFGLEDLLALANEKLRSQSQ